MGLKQQAKILTKQQQTALRAFLERETRHPVRNRLIFQLSVKAGLRAKEIASLTWRMVLTSDGDIADHIELFDRASKGKSGGVIWLNEDLKETLVCYKQQMGAVQLEKTVLMSERGSSFSAQSIVNLFQGWYKRNGMLGCSSHSGRRTFITNAAKKITTVGGSLRDVQMLARHSSLQMTQRYIEADVDAQKKVVQII